MLLRSRWLTAIGCALFGFATLASAQTEGVLHTFAMQTGAVPASGLVRDNLGNFYGTATLGGSSGAGVVYKLGSDGSYSVLYNFTGAADGSKPYAGLLLRTNGNLYGTTYQGGQFGRGTVYKLDPAGQETVLYSFMDGADGGHPYANVISDAAGNLYGTASTGGDAGQGVVYKLDPSGKETVLHSFTGGSDGEQPTFGLVLDPQGNLYGTSGFGGFPAPLPILYGVVFKVSPSGEETILHTFSGGSDGGGPVGTLLRDSQGNLYGATQSGGAFGAGVIFKIDAQGVETVLHDFGAAGDASNPLGSLASGRGGKLYGTTLCDYPDTGSSIFQFDLGTLLDTVVYTADGKSCLNAPLLVSAGALYGTSNTGGKLDNGVVFVVKP